MSIFGKTGKKESAVYFVKEQGCVSLKKIFLILVHFNS